MPIGLLRKTVALLATVVEVSEASPHLKIPRDAGERKGGTQWYAINVHFKIHVAISVK